MHQQNRSSIQKQGGLAFLLVGSVFFLYWTTVKYPFIQDDWCILYSIIHKGSFEFLKLIVRGELQESFYRPVGQIFILALYQIFKLNTFVYRIILLLLFSCNALLVIYLSYKITGQRVLSWIAGFLYAFALGVNIDTLFWIMGVYDLLGAFFFFLSFAFFLNEKRGFSLFCFALGILSKEATVVLPGILFLYNFLIQTPSINGKINQLSSRLRTSLKTILPYAIILGLYLAIRLSVLHLTTTDDGHGSNPYEIGFWGKHIFSNVITYLYWSVQSFLPFLDGTLKSEGMFILILAVVIFIYVRRTAVDPPMLFFLVGWFVVGLLPVIFLTHHAFRYYLVYSLPAILILALNGIRSLRLQDTMFTGVAIMLVLLEFSVSLSNLSEIDRQGFDIPTVDGSNNLSRKGVLVMMTQQYLQLHHPILPQGATLIFDWIPTVAFCTNAGPRIWYQDSTLNVYEIQQVKIDSLGIKPVQGKADYLDLAKTFLIQFHGDYLRETDVRLLTTQRH